MARDGGTMKARTLALLGAAFAVASCADREPPPSRRSPAETGARAVLLRYAPGGWPLARDELERRIAEDFRAADRDGDGRVSYAEAEALNEARRGAGGVVVGRIVDWNKDGFVSLDEFAGAARGAFASIDADDDGQVTEEELNRPAERADAQRKPRRGG
jgi:hypothetical protein